MTDINSATGPQTMIEHKLCYISDGFAYFTTLPLEKQWGDDWNDAPYEHNAGCPYNWRGENDSLPEYSVKILAYSSDMTTPDEIGRYSVEQINSGAIAWLSSPAWSEKYHSIHAGASVDEFTKTIHASGGTVYAPVAVSNPDI